MAIFTRSASDGTRRRIATDNVKDNDIGTPPKETNRGSPASKENSVRAEMKRSRSPLIRTDGNDKNGDSSSSNLEEHREVLTTGYKKRRLTARSYRAYLNGKPARTENPDAGRIFPKMTNGEGEKTKADCLQWEDVEIPKLAESTLNNATSSSYPENQFPSRCSTCSMLQRENNDLQAGIFCSCNAKVGEGLSTSSEEGEPETSGGNLTLTHLKDSSEAIQRDDSYIVCVICKLPGPLLFCGGKGCEACYHLACLDPPKSDVPPGLWLCFCCLRKKMEFGVHSVSEGFESIWDCNEEMQKEKHYFVKYKGLAHVHNQWIPESQLLHKDPMLLAKFNKKHQKEQVKKWKHGWTEPHRLLQKRFLIPPEQVNECSCGHGDNFEYCYLEWFVKWRCLGHEHATWEFENSPFLCSDEGKTLIKDYERRREDAKKASDLSRAGKAVYLKENLLRKLPRLPDGCPHELDNDHLESVSRILKCWHKNQNAVLIDDQERIVKSILFLLNLLPYTCGQFLIISTTSCLLTWEAEFVRLAPSINIVVYSGNRNVRKMIRDLEFYEEGGCIMFQVLLACPNDIVEDFDAFDCVNWEAIIIDDCQKSGVSKHLEQFTNLVSEFRLLLLNSLPKDNIVDYLKLLSVLEASGGEHSVNSLKLDSVAGNDALSILKGRLAQYVVYERKQNSPLFVEYWVPVQLSELQLKQYCSILASNSFLLRSRSRADCVQPLLDVLISIRKCCDHPYLADDSLQRSLTETLPVVEYLDIGVNASAKLQFLDKFLLEMKNRGLRVLILFQSNVGSGRNCMGDILDDFLHQRFGDKSFVYVDSRIDRSRTKAILQSFNEMGRDKFVIVIENLACRARIKLSSVDAIIIYDSDWNPLNDLKALRKITIDSPAQQVKVFRLYSPYTVEEKVLMLAKEDGGLEVDIENTSTRLRHSLLSWGASQLFGKHNEFCKFDSSNALPKPFIDNLLLNAVVDLLTQSPENIDATVAGNCSNITEAHLSGASYSRNISLYGEKEDFSSVDGDPTHFWLKLLETSSSSPRYTSGPSPRIRRGVQFLDKFVKNPQTENYDLKKGRKLGSSTTEVFSKETWLQSRGQEAQGLGGTAAPDHTSCNANQPTLNPTRVTSVAEGIYSKKSEIHNFMGEPIEREKLLDEQKMHHDLLKPEMLQLCETLRFPENVMGTAEMFLKNILENHYVYQEPKSLLQAFILSLCWCAAFFSKHDMNHKESLELAKKYFNFECEEKQVEAIYEKLKLLNDSFSSLMGVSTNIVNLNPLKNQLHEPKTGGTEVLTRNGNSKMTSDDQDVEAREIKERSFCVSRKEPSCMKKVHHFSKDRTVGSSNPTSPILQEIVGGSQTFVPRNDVPKEFLQEGSGEMAASDHQEPEQGKSQPVVPSNDVVENLIGGVGSDILLFDYEEGEIREDPNIQAHEHEKKLQSLKDELLKRRISLIDEIYSARLDALISKQTKESTDFKNQMNQEKKNLVRTSGLDLEMILAANTDLEVNDDDMRKLQQEFSRKIDRFEQHMRSQRKKLLVMQIGARKKEKQLKEQWLEEAELGRSVESYDMLPLSATEFNLEKFREQVEAHDDSGNACSQGCSSDAITRSVGSVDISRSNAVQVTVPNEGMKQTSSEKEMSIGNSKTLIAVESSDQSRIIFNVSTASLSRFPSDELLQNRTSSSQCNGGSGKAVGSAEPVEKNTIISDIVSANLSGGPADRLVQMMLPASQCNFSSGTAVDSTETSSEIPAITPREEMEYILTKKESPACQPRSVNAVEPSRTPPDISETVPCTGPGDKPLETEALVSQPQILDVTGDDLGEVDITSGTPEGHRGGAETDGACLKSSLPSQNNNVSSIHALICAGSENSESQNQISSVELEILAVSGSEPACSPPRSIAIPILDSGDQKLIQVENNNHIPEVSHPVLQQQPPSPNLNSVSASHQRTDAHIQSGLELIRVENSNHIPEASRPVLQQQQPPSAYLTSVSASHEWADAHIQSEQELILVENINHIPDASHPVLQQQPSSANLTSVSASHEWADEHIQSGQEFWNQVHCSDQVHVVSTLAPSVQTVEMGRSSSSLSQSATLPVPIPIIAPENVHHRHLRIANIRQETVNHQQQTLFSNPLQFEMDRLGEEEKSLAQMLVGKKRDLQLKCEKELENVRKKYDALIQGEETLFTQKMEEIKKIQSIVEMNKHLAEEFSGIFFGNKQGTSAVYQGGPSSSPQQFIRSPRPSSSLPQFVRSPRPEVAQRPILASSSTRAPAPNPPRPPTPFSMGTLVPTFQPILNNSGILANNLVMPHINPVQSHMNLHVRREPRAPAPHLRPFRSQSNTFPQNGNR